MWEQAHGLGSVIGLAPSAAAAEVLGTELGIDTENTAKWLTEASRQPDRAALIGEIENHLAAITARGSSTAARRVAARRLRDRLASVRAEHARWQLRPGQLVVIDEASLAGTFALDELVSQARGAGAKVLLVGDWAQLSSIEAGGAFGMLVTDRALAPELTDVRRFTHRWVKAASVQLRVGDQRVIDTYAEHDRIESGTREQMLDELYYAWRTDSAAGLTSLMIAGDLDTVSELNRRARADLVSAGRVAGEGHAVAGGGSAGGRRSGGDPAQRPHPVHRQAVGEER